MKDTPERYPLKKIKKNAVCAEVGVWEGQFSSQILKYNPSELHLIDPWVQQYKKRMYSIEQEKMDKIYNNVKQKFHSDRRVKLHRSRSTDVKFPKKYFDWVYIDGDHTYEAVRKDLEFYYPLVKKGGFLCGDDYGWNCTVDAPRGGPKPAVDEFVKLHGCPIQIKGNQFIISVK